jgi:hypothetical protein
MKKTFYKKVYKKVKKNNGNVTHLKCELYYDLGGYNVFAYQQEPRGYYVSVIPVERQELDGCTMESAVAFSGYKKCIHEVTRKSKKAFAVASELADGAMNDLVQAILNKYGYELGEE